MTHTEIKYSLMSIPPSSVFAQAIIKGAEHNIDSVMQMIFDQSKDNRQLVSDIVGENLLSEIENIMR